MRSVAARPLHRALAVSITLCGLAVGLTATPAAAYPDRVGAVSIDGACEGQLLKLHNQARVDANLPKLREDPAFDQVTRAYAERLATTRNMVHNPDYARQIGPLLPSWYTMGENIGYGRDAGELHTAYMNSTGHRANILSTRYQRIAVGCYRDVNGVAWTVVNFVGSLVAIPERIPAPFHSAGDAVARLRWWTLGASPSNAVVEADAGRLLRGETTLPAYAVGLTNTTTHNETVRPVTRLYYAVFRREPDAGGLNYWVRLNQAGHRLEDIATMFAESPEFRTAYGSLSNAAFVQLVYRNVLERAPDSSGLAYWTDLVNRGMSRGRLLMGFSESVEYGTKTFADVTVSWAYIQMLGRVPTSSERLVWTTALNNGGSVNTMIDSLVRSQPFAARAAAHTY
jgi:uncharacterized protein YkwD